MSIVEIPDSPDSDDDGNPLALPDANGDVGRLIYLLEWARIRGFRLSGTLQVGTITIQSVRDLRQVEGRADRDEPPDPGPWAAAGYKEDE